MSEKVKFVNSEDIELSRKRDASLEKKQNLRYYFKYKGQKRRVDYVLAVASDKDDENEENRRNYLKQLKSKRLIVSKPVKSQVMIHYYFHYYLTFQAPTLQNG